MAGRQSLLTAMARWFRLACGAALALVLGCIDAYAGRLEGIVLFGTVPVPGATITATRGEARLVTVSGDDGTYQFPVLLDGDWALRIELTGFEPLTTSVSVGDATASLRSLLALRSYASIAADTTLVPMAALSSAAPVEADTNRAVGARDAPPTPLDVPSGDLSFAAAESLLVNGSVNNGAASPFAQLAAFGNNRRNQRRLYNGGLGVMFGTSAWDARPFSFSSQKTERPSYDDLEWLGTFGGPVRTSFLRNGPTVFLGFQRSVDHSAVAQSARVPTSLERSGDFSQTLDSQGQSVVVRDPQTALPFPGNRIPSGRLSPQARALLGYYPAANADGVGRNYEASTLAATEQNNLQFRANQNVGRRDSIFGNVAYSRTTGQETDLFGFTDTSRVSASEFAINWGHRLSQFSTLRARYQHQGQGNITVPYFAGRLNVSGEAGITGNNQDVENWGPPRVLFSSGVLGLASPSAADNAATTDTLSVEQMQVIGRHNVTVGAGAGQQHVDIVSQQDARGTWSFTGEQAGVALADFLLGLPATSAIAFGNADKMFDGVTAHAFVNDDWRLSSTLTINAGVRWEYESPLRESAGRLANLVASAGFASVTRVTPDTASQSGLPAGLLRADRAGIQPRVGVAWRPVAGSSLVIRGGYGVYRNSGVYQSLAVLLSQQPPFSTAFNQSSSAVAPLTMAEGFVAKSGALPNTFGVDPGFRVGAAHNWQVSAQRDLPGSLTLVGTYRGTRGVHLMQEFLPNTYPTGAENPCLTCPSGFVYLTSNGTSKRNAGQIQLRRRLRNGLTAAVDYTLASATDNASAFVPLGNPLDTGASATSLTTGTTGITGAVIAQNWRDLNAEASRSAFDQRHLLSMQVQYTSGMGVAGGALMNGWRGLLLNGWTLTSQLTWGSGFPLTPIVLAPVAGTGITGTIRAALTGVDLTPPSGYFLNPAAYTVPAAGQWGDAGRNSMSGPSQFTVNAGVGRSFIWRERLTFDWRLDATNVLNTVVYTRVDTVVGSPLFGQPNRANALRKLQSSLRMRF